MPTFNTKVAGIPCQCHVLYTTPIVPAYIDGAPENCHPEEGGDFDYELLDRKGYRARWLERKLTQADNTRLYREFRDAQH